MSDSPGDPAHSAATPGGSRRKEGQGQIDGPAQAVRQYRLE